MATLRAFAAFRPSPEFVADVASLPYDVVSDEEARAIAQKSPYSFMRVVRSEVCLPEDVDVHAPQVYEKAKENLEELCSKHVIIEEDAPSLYVYRLTINSRSQTGVVGLSSVDEYDRGVIKTHEKTRADKEDDRTKHICTLRAHTGPVFLTYRGCKTIKSLVSEITRGVPLYDFVSFGEVRHEMWRVEDPKALEQAFLQIPCGYVADGHHRAKSASRTREVMKAGNPGHTGEESYNFFLSVLFPDDELQLLAYNRLVLQTPYSPQELRKLLNDIFGLSPCDYTVPREKGEVCVYFDKTWQSFRFSKEQLAGKDMVESLDVQLLGDLLLSPSFGINDPRTSSNIAFVGGVRGTKVLEDAVDCGKAAAAFSMHPVTINDLLSIADAGRLMPPKSTWFEPKLLSGLLVHRF